VEISLAQSCSLKWLILFEKHATANSSANGNNLLKSTLRWDTALRLSIITIIIVVARKAEEQILISQVR